MSASSMRDFYAPRAVTGASPREKLAAAVRTAELATQTAQVPAWEFLVTPTQVELYADFEHALTDADPEGRELTMRCGAALFHLRLALKQHGALGKMELFPLVGQPNLLARVHYGATSHTDDEHAALFAAMTEGGAMRRGSTISEFELEELANVAGREHSMMEVLHTDACRQRLWDCVREGERIRSEGAQATKPFMLRLRIGRALDFGMRSGQAAEVTPDHAFLGILKTREDNTPAWLAAGQAMAGVLLAAKARGIPAVCLNQAVQRSATRAQLRTAIGRKGYPQMVFGFGGLKAEASVPRTAQILTPRLAN